MSIPCFLTNRDVLSVIDMVEQLKRADDVGQITVIDCESTYPPLLDWYSDQTDIEIIRVGNHGNQAMWTHLNLRPNEDYFASDADLDLSGIPSDFLVKLKEKLREPHWRKVALGLRLDDIPDAHPLKAEVLSHEQQFWQRRNGPSWWIADVDTTGVMYRAGSVWNGYGPAVRAALPYVARHVPWYLTPGNVPEDWKHYLTRLVPKGITWSPRLKVALGL